MRKFSFCSFTSLFVYHQPVLFDEVSQWYQNAFRKKYVIDATQGLWGHTRMLIDLAESWATILGIDRDKANIDLAQKALSNIPPDIVYHSIHASFAELSHICNEYRIPNIDFILYDLGVSSAHYDDGERGFSLRYDAPLDMRFHRSAGQTAHDIIMKADASFLKKIFWEYADEKKAHFIAEAIVQERQHRDIATTFALRDIIEKSSFDKKSPIRVFQALRIAVNDEFAHMTTSFTQAIERLSIGGIIAVITFHSIEDRIVKQFFAPYTISPKDDITGQDLYTPKLKKLTRKPILPTEAEITSNPRARSAKLRLFECIS